MGSFVLRNSMGIDNMCYNNYLTFLSYESVAAFCLECSVEIMWYAKYGKYDIIFKMHGKHV